MTLLRLLIRAVGRVVRIAGVVLGNADLFRGNPARHHGPRFGDVEPWDAEQRFSPPDSGAADHQVVRRDAGSGVADGVEELGDGIAGCPIAGGLGFARLEQQALVMAGDLERDETAPTHWAAYFPGVL